jgi:hypothetical protein
MKFKNFLQEEWFASTIEYSIYVNPSNKEKIDTMQTSREDGYGSRCRVLIDREDNDIYLFPAGLLHDKACDKIDKSKTKEYAKYFYPLMGLWNESKFHFIIFHTDDIDKDEKEAYKILKNKGWNPVIGFENIPDELFGA